MMQSPHVQVNKSTVQWFFLPFLKATCTFSFGKIYTFWNKLGKSRNKISLKKRSNYWFKTAIFCSQMPLSYHCYYQESKRVRKIYKGTSLYNIRCRKMTRHAALKSIYSLYLRKYLSRTLYSDSFSKDNVISFRIH